MAEIVDSKLKTVAKGATILSVGIVISMLLWMVARILIVRSILPEEFGLYSLVIATVSVLAIVASGGLYEGVAKYVSTFAGEGRIRDAETVARSALRKGLVFGAIASASLFIFAPLIARFLFFKPELTAPLKIASFFVIFYVLSNIYVGILRGYGLVKSQAYFIYIGNPLIFLILVTTFFAFGLPFVSIIYAYVISMVAVFTGICIYGYKAVRFTPFGETGFGGELLGFSLPLLGATVLQLVMIWTDSFMLGRYTRMEDVGIYSISISLARLLTYGTDAIAFVFLPVASELYARKQHTELKRTYQILTKWSFSAILPVFFVLFFFPEMVIRFLFGEEYVISASPLRVLGFAFVINIFMGIGGILLMVLGRSRTILNITVFTAILNVVLNYVLIKRLGYGVMGAAWATATTYTLGGFIGTFLCYRYSRIHPFRVKYLKPVASLAGCGLLIYAAAKTLPFHFWLLPLYFALFIGGYVTVILISGSLDREDLMMLEAVSSRTGVEMKTVKKIFYRFAKD